MIIDAIIDAKEDGSYMGLKYLYDEAMFFGFHPLASAIDLGDNSNIQRELCEYIDSEGYNPGLKEFVNGFDWVGEAMEKSEIIQSVKRVLEL